jgi:glycosyltransferase involved in cell wall biosynthesis
MKFSIIIPSYNQEEYIAETLKNIQYLKDFSKKNNIEIEVLLFDNCSNETVQKIIKAHISILDYYEITQDKGQYDAINKGLAKITGDYWTWLNTDDLINIDGFLEIVKFLEKNDDVDYIYGNMYLINGASIVQKILKLHEITLNTLVNIDCSTFQPGSFFKSSFTKKIGLLKAYNCCFDYEYILRLLKFGGKAYYLDFPVVYFRFHSSSKSASLKMNFIKDELEIRKLYGRKLFSPLTFNLYKGYLKTIILKML